MLQLFPENTTEKLEFNQIISLLIENCVSELGVEHFSKNEFFTRADTIRFKFKQISEFNDIRLNNFNFPLDNFLDGRNILKRLEIDGTVLAPEDLFVLKKILNTTVGIFEFFKKHQEKYTYLKTLINELYNPDNEFKILDRIFDDEGFIYDNASPKLKEIRNKIRVTENQAERLFGKLLEKYRKQGWISDEEQSVRQGERVLSIQSKFKRNIDGIIVDLSSTGKSTYIQPSEIMQLKNKVFELKQEENQEVLRICRELTEQLRTIKDELQRYFYLFEELDVIQAKERLLRNFNGSCPKITDGASILLNNAYHPLLYIKNKSKKVETIPLNLSIDNENRILLVSGPNAGGKSVCLKTTGLLQMMVQSAIPVPVDDSSIFGIFDKIFVDIGDNQSIENDLSTYSSKLKNLKICLSDSDERSLFLLDEFGAGTDPQLGGYISEVALKGLLKNNAKGIVTTHYSNLKSFADQNEGMFNGAMVFDTENLSPTYKLEIGKPGSSYTFEIIKSLGFDDSFIAEAKEKLGDSSLGFDQMLIKLQQENKETEELKLKLLDKEKQLDKLLNENKKFKQEIKQRKDDIYSQSRQKANAYLDSFNRKFEGLLKAWKEAEKEKDRTIAQKRITKNIKATQEKISKEIARSKPAKVVEKKDLGKIEVGDMVKLIESSQVGTVVKIIKNKATIEFDHIKTEVDVLRLEKLEHKKAVKAKVKLLNASQGQSFRPELDLRGKRRDEALSLTEEFLDKALLFKFNHLRIIHGYGDGILKKSIREMLKKYDFIKSFNAESEEQGGDGVTLVSLK